MQCGEANRTSVICVHMRDYIQVMGVRDFTARNTLYLELAISLFLILAPLLYILYVFCLKRREHPKNIRTGSIKSGGAPQTSPNVSRKVSVHIYTLATSSF